MWGMGYRDEVKGKGVLAKNRHNRLPFLIDKKTMSHADTGCSTRNGIAYHNIEMISNQTIHTSKDY